MMNTQGHSDKCSIDSNLKEIAFMARSLADENRLRILLAVSQEKKTVSKIVEQVGLSQPLVSHHLKELKRALIVDVERDGVFVLYQVGDKRLLKIISMLHELTQDRLRMRNSF